MVSVLHSHVPIFDNLTLGLFWSSGRTQPPTSYFAHSSFTFPSWAFRIESALDRPFLPLSEPVITLCRCAVPCTAVRIDLYSIGLSYPECFICATFRVVTLLCLPLLRLSDVCVFETGHYSRVRNCIPPPPAAVFCANISWIHRTYKAMFAVKYKPSLFRLRNSYLRLPLLELQSQSRREAL